MLNKIEIFSGNKKHVYLIIILLIAASCAALGRIAFNDFINLDDTKYVTENNYVQSGFNTESIKWLATTTNFGYWHPVTLISHMLDWRLFGANASGHHLVSLLLHIGAVIFLFLFLNKSTSNIWSSAFAAAIFAFHPLRVESVAWIGERKDVLSMLFGMACLYAYVLYTEAPKASKYFLCLILFILSLMAKPMMVSLPFVLLLLDYWPLGRLQKIFPPADVPVAAAEKVKKNKSRKNNNIKEKKISAPVANQAAIIRFLLWEKAPFLCLSIVFSILAFWMQNKEGLVMSPETIPLITRISNAFVSYAAYLGKIFWPVDLAVFYPYEYFLPLWQALISGIILIIITLAVCYYVKKLPFLFTGWFWYLGTLIPVIGLIQISTFSMADRYTYLPSIGIAIALAWGIPSLIKNEDIRKKILFPAGIALLFILLIITWRQCGYWKNSTALFSHALRITKDNDFSRNGLCLGLFQEEKFKEAVDNCSEAIRMNPSSLYGLDNRGGAYFKLGQYQLAIEDFNTAIRLKPDYAYAYNKRGAAYSALGQHQRAIEDFSEAIRLKPDYAKAYYNRGEAYIKLGQYQHAVVDYDNAILYKPDYADAYNNRAFIYLNLRNIKAGCDDALRACELGECNLLKAAKSKGDCQ
ncbi:MAG TPA: tetratricopeptide repeat protein [Smithella sp.]|nr:tetratricopeptide repeat protein [Smithella sp.]